MVNLLLVDEDSSFCLGFRVWLEKYPGWRVSAIASSKTEALSLLQRQSFDLVVVELAISNGLELCQAIKQHFPATKVFLLTGSETPVLIEGALTLGVEGYCPKGVEATTLLKALATVATGHKYRWQPFRPQNWSRAVRLHLRDTGLATIDFTLFGLAHKLSDHNLLPIERLVWEGRRRELRCARWLIERLWHVDQPSTVIASSEDSRSSLTLPDRLLASLAPKLTYSLDNLTDLPLEIDILLPDRRQQLLQITLEEFRRTLEQCRRSQLTAEQIQQQWQAIITDLWVRTTGAFLGEYTPLTDRVLQDRPLVEGAILHTIPLVPELLSSILWQTPIGLAHNLWQADSPQALIYLQDLLDNLVIQVANAVIQPLLNSFAQDEAVKQKFFQYRSSREIERFRNELSWKYRYNFWVREPRHIFESKQELWIINSSGIDRVYINHSRSVELNNLKGWQFFVTLALEFQDALTPRIRSVIDFVGRGIVFVLTEVIGRGIGLIGRGIIRGIGYAWQPEGKVRRPHN